MKLTEKIKAIAAQKGDTFASIERQLDFGQGSIRRWDVNSPSADKLKKVANLLGVSIDWLLDEDNTINAQNVAEEAKPEEAKPEETKPEEPLSRLLISNFNALSEKGQNDLVNHSAVLLEKEKEKKRADEEMVTVPIYSREKGKTEWKMTKAEYDKLAREIEEYDASKYKGLV